MKCYNQAQLMQNLIDYELVRSFYIIIFLFKIAYLKKSGIEYKKQLVRK